MILEIARKAKRSASAMKKETKQGLITEPRRLLQRSNGQLNCIQIILEPPLASKANKRGLASIAPIPKRISGLNAVFRLLRVFEKVSQQTYNLLEVGNPLVDSTDRFADLAHQSYADFLFKQCSRLG